MKKWRFFRHSPLASKLCLTLLVWFAALAFACAESSAPSDDIDLPGKDDPPGEDDPPGKDDPPPEDPSLPKTAEAWARALIAQTVSTQSAFQAIAYDSGFPVITDDQNVIFMHWYEGGQWSVAGDFNGWSPQPMRQVGDIWVAEVPLAEVQRQGIGYKFVNGADYVADPWALYYGYDAFGQISYVTKPPPPYLMRWNMFTSPQGLKTRAIHAWVPQGSGPFAVLYAHDGQNLFDAQAMGGGWRLRENLAEIEADFIVVAIDNSEDRMSEYTHVNDTIDGFEVVAKGDAYAEFVEMTVRPFVESKFSTTKAAGLMGSSLGGLISLYIAHKYPNRYRAVLALSPTTAWGNFSQNTPTMQALYEAAGHRSTVLYLDSGGGEGDGCKSDPGEAAKDEALRDNYCFTRAFVDAMQTTGYTFGVDLFHWHEPGALHNEAAWAARVSRPLSLFMSLNQ